jgi:citrate lyase subunit beta/citryl-CoA lyase
VPILNELFSPSPEEVEQAGLIVAALEQAGRAGHGAAALHGRMIDAPIAARARRVLERHNAITQRRARGL